MNDLEQYELRQIADDIRLRWRDFEIDESKPSRLRASFTGYVILPSLLFGILAGILSMGMLTLTAIVLSYVVGETARDAFDIIIAAGAGSVTSVVMAYAAVLMIDDWRDLQWETKTRRYFGQPKREKPTGRIITEVAPGQRVVSRLDWDLQWRERLARKVYDERGQWIGGAKVARDRHMTDPNLYPNITGNWDAAKTDLRRWGYIDEDDQWTDKAKGELLARLRIV